MSENLFQAVKRFTPRSAAEAYEALLESHERARRIYRWENGQVLMDPDELVGDYTRTIGAMQTADFSVEPPLSVARSVARSVASSLTAIAVYSYKAGRLVNEYLAVEGPGGIGKSTYAKMVAAAWSGLVVYDVDEFLEGVERLLAGEGWTPILVLDDVAAMISKYWIFTGDKERLKHLFQLVELSKDWTGVVLMTARSFEGVAKRFRELSTLVGTAKRFYVEGYIIDYIEWRRPGKRLPEYIDYLWPGLLMPREEWERMMQKRRSKAMELLAGVRGGGGEA